jgi:hypothetical protein
MDRIFVSLIFVCLVVSKPGGAAEPFSLKIKATYGVFGPPRTGPIPFGDNIIFSSSVSGLTHDPDGNVDFSVKYELLWPNGKSEAVGSDSYQGKILATVVKCQSFLHWGEENPAGSYTYRTTITDNVCGRQVTAETPLQIVKPKGVTLLQLRCGSEMKEKTLPVAGATVVVGEALYVNCLIYNYTPKDLLTKFRTSLTVFDLDGNPVKWGPQGETDGEFVLDRYGVDQNVTYEGLVATCEPGKFILRVHLKDVIGKTETTEYLPFQVLEAPDWKMPQLARKEDRSEKKPAKRK